MVSNNNDVTTLVIPNAEVEKNLLNDVYNGDISYYIDERWSNCNGMQYEDGYVIQDFETGEMYFLRVID